MYYYRGLVILKITDENSNYWNIGDTVDCFGRPKKPEVTADYFGCEWHDSTHTLTDAKWQIDMFYFNNEGERI